MTPEDYQHEHWQGTKNKLIRYYFYCNRGLDTFNNFRYIIMAIFGLYFTMHLHQPWWLLLMFFISIPLLMVIGYFSIFHMGKVINWLDVKFGSHYGKYTYELMESQLKALNEINKELRRDT